MDGFKRIEWRQTSLSDTAVDGLLGGLEAGVVMAIVLVVLGLSAGDVPPSLLGRFDPSQRAQPFVGALVHLSVAGVYGSLFGIIMPAIGGWPCSTICSKRAVHFC